MVPKLKGGVKKWVPQEKEEHKEDPRRRCVEITSKGVQCRRKEKNQGRCHQHEQICRNPEGY